MREHDDIPYIVIERSGSGFMPFLFGAAVGAIVGLLYAPKPGAETQADLKERAQKLRQRAEEAVEDLGGSLQDALETGRTQFDKKLDTAKRSVEEGRAKAQQAFDAGKNAAKAARSEFEERLGAEEDDEAAAG